MRRDALTFTWVGFCGTAVEHSLHVQRPPAQGLVLCARGCCSIVSRRDSQQSDVSLGALEEAIAPTHVACIASRTLPSIAPLSPSAEYPPPKCELPLLCPAVAARGCDRVRSFRILSHTLPRNHRQGEEGAAPHQIAARHAPQLQLRCKQFSFALWSGEACTPDRGRGVRGAGRGAWWAHSLSGARLLSNTQSACYLRGYARRSTP